MSERIASLDLLRGVAATAVAVPHFLIYSGAGGPLLEATSVIAVELFFVLSGYVLAPQILLVLERRSLRDLGTFLLRRWMRTVPAYAVALLLVSALVGAVGSAEFWRYLLYVQNLIGQHNAHDYYSIAWSLSVEEWFYVAFPLFLLTVAIAGGQRHALTALAFILVVTALRSAFGDPHDWGAGVRRIVVFHVDSIAYGFLLFLALRRRAIGRPLPLAAGLLLSAALTLWLLQVVDHSRAAQAAYPLAVALFGSLTIALALALEPIAQRLGAIAAVAGATSYAVYLYHLLAIYLLARVDWPLWAGFCAFCCLTALLAAASSYGLEKPILAMRPSYDRDAAAAEARVTPRRPAVSWISQGCPSRRTGSQASVAGVRSIGQTKPAGDRQVGVGIIAELDATRHVDGVGDAGANSGTRDAADHRVLAHIEWRIAGERRRPHRVNDVANALRDRPGRRS